MDLFVIFIFIFGACLGSFLCVLADRLPRGEQVLRGRSHCERCRHVLAPIDLIPVISYLASGGRCKYCHTRLPIHLLLLEILSGFVLAFLYLYSVYLAMPALFFILLSIIFFCYIGIFVSDQLTGIIPDEFNVVIGVATLLMLIFYHPTDLVVHIASGLGAFIFFLSLYLATRGRGMGFGDVKLAFLLGFFLGFPQIIVSLYFAFLTATFVSLILVILGKKKLRGGTIYFGPFLVAGGVFAYFLTDQVIKLFF